MGFRRTNPTSPIQNPKEKQTTFCKRKRGLLKKAIELSMLCEQFIYLVIFDQNK